MHTDAEDMVNVKLSSSCYGYDEFRKILKDYNRALLLIEEYDCQMSRCSQAWSRYAGIVP